MTGFLSFDFFTMRKKFSTYVCMFLPSVFAFLVTFVIFLIAEVGMTYYSVIDSVIKFSQVTVSVYYAMLMHSDWKKGYIKNIAGTTKHKYLYILSKCISLIAFNLLTMLFLACFAWVFCTVFCRQVVFEPFGDFLRYYITLFVLWCGAMAVILFASTLFRNIGSTISFALLYSLNVLPSLFYLALSLIFDKLDIDFNFDYVSVSRQISRISLNTNTADTWTAIGIGAVYLIVFTALSCLVFQKRDTA